jgi:hypothetical protein
MVELGCDTCGKHLAIVLNVTVAGVVALLHPSTECECIRRLPAGELLTVLEDAYSAEDWVQQAT